MTYYMFEQKRAGSGTVYRRIEEYPSVEGIDTWMAGGRFLAPVPEPLEFTLDRETPGRMFVFNNVQVPLMRADLVGALREIGVTNMDTYRALIHDPLEGRDYDGYYAVNIIGVIAAANLDESEFNPEVSERLIAMQFGSLSIDEAKTVGALMFRLAECVSGVVIHEKVRDHLMARGFRQLGFVDPADWSG